MIVLGGGAAGLFCASVAGKRGRSVAVLERNGVVGEKIRISGGGRCNFTNAFADHGNFLSHNPDFCRSALSRFTPKDFIRLVERYGIPYHEKKLGQLFCDDSSQRIIDMLVKECGKSGVDIRTGVEIASVRKNDAFVVETSAGTRRAKSLVIATGGLSIPKLGATDLGYRIATQFGLNLTTPKPGLVPFTIASSGDGRKKVGDLAGISVDAQIECNGASFRENILFTHRGISGPAALQMSSYWEPGSEISVDLMPGRRLMKEIVPFSSRSLLNALDVCFPRRFAEWWLDPDEAGKGVRSIPTSRMRELEEELHSWKLVPSGTEGFGKAEVTVGGVDTRGLSSKTMESRKVPGLYFIGEVVDVTGWLGGYNFQWAWSSGYCAGMSV